MSFRYIFLLLCLGVFSFNSSAKKKEIKASDTFDIWMVDTLMAPIPIKRQLFSDRIYQKMEAMDAHDGVKDNWISYPDAANTEGVTRAYFEDLPRLVINIENLPIDHFEKVRYLTLLRDIVKRYSYEELGWRDPEFLSQIITNYKDFIKADLTGDKASFVTSHLDEGMYQNRFLLEEMDSARKALYVWMAEKDPRRALGDFKEYQNAPYACNVLAKIAPKFPNLILDFSRANTPQGAVVRRCNDPYIKSIVKLSQEATYPWSLLPFIHQINNGKTSIEALNALPPNSDTFYKALVKLKMEETDPYLLPQLEKQLFEHGLTYVLIINELHNSVDTNRFKVLDHLNAFELYYAMIAGKDEIYTSSFINGTFKKMLQQMKPMSGNVFMNKVGKDHFRTFLRMCAGFNTLQDFLATFDQGADTQLLEEFVDHLGQGSWDQIEDAVDVADAYGSITDPRLLNFLKEKVTKHYQAQKQLNQGQETKGYVVYGLLKDLFHLKSSGHQADFPIATLENLPYDSLVDGENGVVELVFFYGDNTGVYLYQNLLSQFSPSEWRIEKTNHYWTTVYSIKGKKVTVYMNHPLPEENGEDEDAQRRLTQYLAENHIHPSIVVHRSHSYYLPNTLKYLPSSAQVVMLGSCGGYHNLSEVLERAPEANVIASKQIGATRVNVPIINALNRYAFAGENYDWEKMWHELNQEFATKDQGTRDLFVDYIPPNQNYGLLFMRAYRDYRLGMKK